MSKDFMAKQLTQIFIYAELSKRLTDCLELLDPEEGYASETVISKEIKDLQETIRTQMKQHLSNSNISDRAMNIINNMRYFANRERE